MQDSEGASVHVACLVHGAKPVERVERYPEDHGDRKFSHRNEIVEAPTLDVVEHDEGTCCVSADLLRTDDVRVVDARRDAGLGEEALDGVGHRQELQVQPLDDHEPLEATRSDRAREVRLGHPAFTELEDGLEIGVVGLATPCARHCAQCVPVMLRKAPPSTSDAPSAVRDPDSFQSVRTRPT